MTLEDILSGSHMLKILTLRRQTATTPPDQQRLAKQKKQKMGSETQQSLMVQILGGRKGKNSLKGGIESPEETVEGLSSLRPCSGSSSSWCFSTPACWPPSTIANQSGWTTSRKSPTFSLLYFLLWRCFSRCMLWDFRATLSPFSIVLIFSSCSA